jgi:pseudouridine kinase
MVMSKPVICIGSALVDELFHAAGEILLATTSNAVIHRTAGGVARNIAHQLALLDVPVQLISVFGKDKDGEWLSAVSQMAGVRLDAAITSEDRTGRYTGILHANGSLFAAFLTNPVDHLITAAYLQSRQDLLFTASFLLADANLNADTIEWLLAFSRVTGIPLIIETVSVPHAAKLAPLDLSGLYMITPNEDELRVLCPRGLSSVDAQTQALKDKGVEHTWLHSGANGSIVFSRDKILSLNAPVLDVVDCTGAGDGSVTGFLLGKYLGKDDLECLKIAHTLAAEILQVNGAIATHLDRQKLLTQVHHYFPGI